MKNREAIVPRLMQDWLALFQNTCKEKALTAYVWLHVSFVRIHPFWNGNGRMARLIANVPVIKAGFPPIIVLKGRRQEYIEALSEHHLAVGTITARSELLPEGDKLDRFKQFCSESWSESIKLVDEAHKKQGKRN